MSARVKNLSLGWLVLFIVVVAAGLILWLHYRATSGGSSRRYTSQEWLQMVTRREHQPVATWKGIDVGYIREDSESHGLGGVVFGNTPAHVLEHQFVDIIEREPLAFLRLFDSKDPGVILTGVYIYRRSSAFVERLSTEDKSLVVAAFRKLLSHDDVRVRFTAIQMLGNKGWLSVDDVERGFDDKALSVRVVTAWSVRDVAEKPARYSPQGELLGTDPNRTEKVAIKRRLAPVLLDHLNDSYFIIRSEVYGAFRCLFAKGETNADRSGHDLKATFPARVDWVRADWHTREQGREAWNAWWGEHAEEALHWTHPSN